MLLGAATSLTFHAMPDMDICARFVGRKSARGIDEFVSYVQRVFALSRAGFAGGSNVQIGWGHDEQDDEQILS